MTSISLAMETAGRDADIEIEGIAGDGLKEVEDVEAKGNRLAVAGIDLDLERKALPQDAPLCECGPPGASKGPLRLFQEDASASGSLIDRSLDVNSVTIFAMVIVAGSTSVENS